MLIHVELVVTRGNARVVPKSLLSNLVSSTVDSLSKSMFVLNLPPHAHMHYCVSSFASKTSSP